MFHYLQFGSNILFWEGRWGTCNYMEEVMKVPGDVAAACIGKRGDERRCDFQIMLIQSLSACLSPYRSLFLSPPPLSLSFSLFLGDHINHYWLFPTRCRKCKVKEGQFTSLGFSRTPGPGNYRITVRSCLQGCIDICRYVYTHLCWVIDIHRDETHIRTHEHVPALTHI